MKKCPNRAPVFGPVQIDTGLPLPLNRKARRMTDSMLRAENAKDRRERLDRAAAEVLKREELIALRTAGAMPAVTAPPAAEGVGARLLDKAKSLFGFGASQ